MGLEMDHESQHPKRPRKVPTRLTLNKTARHQSGVRLLGTELGQYQREGRRLRFVGIITELPSFGGK